MRGRRSNHGQCDVVLDGAFVGSWRGLQGQKGNLREAGKFPLISQCVLVEAVDPTYVGVL